MTVDELIRELQKYPAHHTVMLATFEPAPMDCGGGPQEVWSFIDTVGAASNVGNTGPIVRIVAEGA